MATRSRRSPTADASNKGSRSLRKRKLKEDTSPSTAESMCRVCMRWLSDPLMVDLFRQTVRELKLSEVLALVGAVHISEDDRLPKLCCTRCLKDLEQAYKLRTRCRDSDQKLRELYCDVEVTVVKEEFDADEMNPLDVVCKPDVDQLMDDAEPTTVPVEAVVLPKLEIKADNEDDDNEKDTSHSIEDSRIHQEDDDVEDSNEMGNDGAATESDVGDGDGDGEAEKLPHKPRHKQDKKEPKKSDYPDVFDEIPAVGFRCCGCKNVFDTFEELLTHSQEVHAEKKLPESQLKQKTQCDICYKVLSQRAVLGKHKTLGKVNFRCKTCGDVFWSKRRVCDHFNRIHGPNATVSGPTRICCACLEKFETEQELKEHCEKVHLPEKPPHDPNRPFVCNICYRNYRTDLHLYNHQTRVSKNEKKHMCVECGKTFKHPSVLRDHEIHHAGKKVFKCSQCPSSYSSRESYRKHIQIHDMPADKYKCPTCGRCFMTCTGLREHVRLHTGERPHQCPHCQTTYARKSSLSIHMLTHTGEKRFACPVCGKQFGTASAHQKHVEFVHYKLYRFPCFFCPKLYPRKDYRKRHMVSAHPNELRDNPVPETELYGSSMHNKLPRQAEGSSESQPCPKE